MKTYQTANMAFSGIAGLSAEALDKLAEGCASGRCEACETCPLLELPGCSRELIALLRRRALHDMRTVAALLDCTKYGYPLCEICAHGPRNQLRACDVNCHIVPDCSGDDPSCGSCTCLSCRDFSAFEVYDRAE